MTERKTAANRENSRASTGPRTAAGRARSARNSRRHGLATPLGPHLLEEARRLARQFAGDGAPPDLHDLAWPIAHCELELRRVRQERDRLFSQALGAVGNEGTRLADPHGSGAVAILSRHVRALQAVDRYEKRVLSRQKRAMRAFIKQSKKLHRFNPTRSRNKVANDNGAE
jgi:hypothetical protein